MAMNRMARWANADVSSRNLWASFELGTRRCADTLGYLFPRSIVVMPGPNEGVGDFMEDRSTYLLGRAQLGERARQADSRGRENSLPRTPPRTVKRHGPRLKAMGVKQFAGQLIRIIKFHTQILLPTSTTFFSPCRPGQYP